MGEMAEERRNAGAVGGGRGGRGVRWEVFLPQMCVRVLLVEADDATRHIIAALLRKCSYRVAAAADGLKAWETLKEKSQNIDLVLTEVELPSVSGYGLLTMITEHEAYKNIPVIMMSSHDSVNTVFKCMLKGAADFLIKPVRKNELRNLWHHVWRRHSSYGLPRVRYKHHAENLIQQKNGANSENNAGRNHCRDCIVSLHNEKGCDTQISWARPDMDAESENAQNMQQNILPDCISSSLVNSMRNHEDDVCDKLAEKPPPQESETEGCAEDANGQCEEKSQQDCQSKSSQEVDLIGAMDKHSCSNHGLENCSDLQVDILDDAQGQTCEPLLELTLRRTQSISTANNDMDEFGMLNHSNSSAFSRYNRTALSPPLTSNSSRRSEFESSKDQVPFHDTSSKYSVSPLNMALQDVYASIGVPPKKYGSVPCSHLGLLSIPISMSHTDYGLSSSYSPIIPPLVYASGTPVWSSKPDDHEGTHSSLSHLSEGENFSSGHYGDPCGQTVQNNFYQMQKEGMRNTESLNERSHVTSVTGQSSTCNGSTSHDNNSGYGSVCDGGNVNLTVTNDSNKRAGFHCSALRQAALIKFRLKRKERCHEKVHYQSRKRLAKERPLLTRKFVHQVQHDPRPMVADRYAAVNNCMPIQT